MKELVPWLWIVAIALVFWLLIIRPASRRQKEALRLQSALAVGDDVMLTSGIFGTITAVTDDHLEVEVATGVALRVVRGAVASLRRDVVPADEHTEDADPATEPAPRDTDTDQER